MVLLAAIGGFRPGVVEMLKYRQTSVQVVRHPKTGEKTTTVAFTLQQNKLQPHAIKTDQKDVVEFSVTLVPYRLFCPASLVIAQGLAEDAFDPSFGSAEEEFKRPLLEKGTQCVTLPWKEELLDKEIFPIFYRTFWDIWDRVMLVAGFPESLRPYSLRVGAGSILNGALTSTLRNYILSHSSKMFERSYQPRHIKEDLVTILDTEAQAEDASDLFQMLRNASLRCDQLAPIDVPPEDIEKWKNTREDMRALVNSNDYRKSTRIQVLTKKLSRARVAELRSQYFKEANHRQALGQETDDLRAPRPKKRINRGVEFPAEAISEYVKKDRTDDGKTLQFIYIDKLVSYLEQRSEGVPTCFICAGTNTLESRGKAGDGIFKSWKDVWKHTNRAHRSERLWPFSCPECIRLGNGETMDQIADIGEWCCHVHEHHAPRGLAPYRCILGCQTFENTTTLREHLIKCHPVLWTVAEPFPCPECCRLGLGDSIISDPAEWRRHVGLYHDPGLLPPMTEATRANRTSHRCLLCSDRSYPTRTGLSLHNTNIHVKGDNFTMPFPFPECWRLDKVEVVISGLDEWCQHVAAHHGEEHAPNPPAPMDQRPLCLLCNTSTYNPRKHFETEHLKIGQFDEPFLCPECVRRGADIPHLVLNCNDWHVHCVASHGQEAPWGIQKVAGKTPYARCLVCNGHFKGISAHFTKAHVAQGLFEKEFSCPECVRTKTDRSKPPLIQGSEEWRIHCAVVHGNVSSSALAHSINLSRKQTEMERLANNN